MLKIEKGKKRIPWDGKPEETKTVRERVKDVVSKPPEARGKPETSAEAPKKTVKSLGKRLRETFLEPYKYKATCRRSGCG